jgi:predicted SprT family Zn-dependent metalloprotease
MNLGDAANMARSLMTDHGLHDWTFEFDGAKKRFGQTKFGPDVISLSMRLTYMNDEARVREVILHEIAHALAGPNHHHDDYWKATARSIGASDSRTYDSDEVNIPKGRWIGVCPNGHRTQPRHRRGRLACKKCSPYFDSRYLFKWEENN